MPSRRWILLVGAVLLGLLATTWMAAAPRITNEFSVGDLGEPNQGSHELVEGAGFLPGSTVSNSFVAHDTMRSGKAGRYSSGGGNINASGERETFHAEFRAGPWSNIASTPLERAILTGAGDPWLQYSVRLQGAITPDGSQWLFRPEISGKGPGGEFSVLASCHFFPMSRALTVTVTERFGNETPRSYALIYDVAFDGQLSPRDR
jgi:hypothetical protein